MYTAINVKNYKSIWFNMLKPTKSDTESLITILTVVILPGDTHQC